MLSRNCCSVDNRRKIMSLYQKTVLLVMPPQLGLLTGFSAGLISLANFVSARQPSTTVEILDLSEQSVDGACSLLRSVLTNLKGDVLVGITTTTASYQSALTVARIVKTNLPQAFVVLGGHHTTADYETVLKNHHEIINSIVLGEGERSLNELVKRFPEVDNVSGVAFWKNGAVQRTPSAQALSQEELDSIPVNFHGNGLIGRPGKFDHVTYVSARGCPLPCAFCAVGNDRIRGKSIEAVAKDVNALLELGFSQIAIEDNFFAHSLKRTREICEALAEIKRYTNSAFTWDCQTRVESLSRPGVIDLMAKGGCEAVYIGVEAFDHEQLLYLKKTREPNRYVQLLKTKVIPDLLKSSINCYINLQFGLPGETNEHRKRTIQVLQSIGRLALEYRKKITVFPQLHVVYPGTAHFRQGVAAKRFLPDVFEQFTAWESRELPVLFWLGEHFAHGTGGIPEGIMKIHLLRENRFEIDSSAVFDILNTLRSIERIPGIELFKYGRFIVSEPT